MNTSLVDLLALGERVKEREPLGPRTTLRVGGPADLLIEARSVPELIRFVRAARQNQVPLLILGNGSNVLVSDEGFRGLVIENHCDQYWLDIPQANGRAHLHAESGAALPGLANRMARQGWSGLEWAVGVPGTIGGAVTGNAGAHKGCIADKVVKVSIVDEADQVRELPRAELAFAYRTSRFRTRRGEVILSADFVLERGDPQECIARMNEHIEHRRRTQPTNPSVGSMFKNPPGDYAGRLIEQAGLKGMRVGNIQVSEVHANFFVNLGGATAKDVLKLIEIVRARVRERFGVTMELEVELVGEPSW